MKKIYMAPTSEQMIVNANAIMASSPEDPFGFPGSEPGAAGAPKRPLM